MVQIKEFNNCEELIATVNELANISLIVLACNYWDIEASENMVDMQSNWESDCFKNSIFSFESLCESIFELKENINKYQQSYELFSDRTSQNVFFNLLKLKLCGDADFFQKAFTGSYQYFSDEIFEYGNDEVYVDCGVCEGENIVDFISHCIDFKKIYAYEPIEESWKESSKILEWFINEGDLDYKNKAVSSKKQKLHFDMQGETRGGSRIAENGKLIVDAVCLDEDIKDKITFIKMDVEGAEKEILEGAKKHIYEDCPKMAVCVYHLIDDLWKIPLMICELQTNYDFKLRHHREYKSYETVLYCIPRTKEMPPVKISDNEKTFNRLLALNIARKEGRQKDLFGTINPSYVSAIANEKRYKGTQARNYKKVADELSAYIKQLEEAKAWLSGQYENYKKLYEDLLEEKS